MKNSLKIASLIIYTAAIIISMFLVAKGDINNAIYFLLWAILIQKWIAE